MITIQHPTGTLQITRQELALLIQRLDASIARQRHLIAVARQCPEALSTRGMEARLDADLTLFLKLKAALGPYSIPGGPDGDT